MHQLQVEGGHAMPCGASARLSQQLCLLAMPYQQSKLHIVLSNHDDRVSESRQVASLEELRLVIPISLKSC